MLPVTIIIKTINNHRVIYWLLAPMCWILHSLLHCTLYYVNLAVEKFGALSSDLHPLV